MYCPNCHAKLIDSDQFCSKCGCRIEQETEAPSAKGPAAPSGQTAPKAAAQSAVLPAAEKSGATKAVIAVCALLVLAALALLWFYVLSPGKAPQSISAYPSALTLQAGSQQTISCVLVPESASAQDLIWTSSNAAVAKALDGTIVGVAPGTCTVTVASKKASNVFAQVSVEVKAETAVSAPAESAAPPAAVTPAAGQTAGADEAIKQIKSWYYSFQNNSSVQQKRIDESLSVSTLDGELGEITIWPVPQDVNNPNGYIIFNYYHGGVPYFTLLQDSSKNLIRLYFANGGLIAWIEPDGVLHYGSNANYDVWYGRAASMYSQCYDTEFSPT